MQHRFRAARSVLARARHRLSDRRSTSPYVLFGVGSVDTGTPLPPGAADELRGDNPRLVELRREYAAVDGPLSRHSFWTDEYRRVEVDLAYFRGDTAYVWQHRRLGDLRLKLFVYLQYIEQLDQRSLLPTLGEDGAFGCWSYEFAGHPRVSRDLLDSVNELYYLDRAWGLFDRRGFSILDIGAGYGRLAHRTIAAVPGLERYYCVDAVPESTFLSEYYLRYRGVDDRAIVVPLPELDALPVGGIDLAVNIHSFSEMSIEAIDAWLAHLVRLRVPNLLVIPNDAEGLLSVEDDGSRREAEGRILHAGYVRTGEEPIFLEPNLPDLLGVADRYYFYTRVAGS